MTVFGQVGLTLQQGDPSHSRFDTVN